jgi:hypothetical protein
MNISKVEKALEEFQNYLAENEVNINSQEMLAEYSREFLELYVTIDDGEEILSQLECDSSDPPGWFVEYALNFQEEPVGFYRMLRHDEIEIAPSVNLPASLATLFLQCWLEHKVWLLSVAGTKSQD